MQKKIYVYLYTGLLAIMIIPCVHANQTCYVRCNSNRFEQILHTIKNAVEEQVLIKNKYNYNPLDFFYKGIESACNDFSIIENEFISGAFVGHNTIHENFKKLCTTITKIDSILYKPLNLRPRHIRWLKDNILQFARTAAAIEKKVTNQADFKLIYIIQDFAKTINFSIFPYCLRYIGSSFEHLRDLSIHRPFEFLKKNWWWTIPTAAVATKVAWNALNFPENQKQDPKDWTMQTNDQPHDSWYKKIISLVAAVVFASQLKDGYIKMDGHTYVGKPLGLEEHEETHNAEYKQYKTELVRGEDETVIGDPKQVGIDPFRFERHYNKRIITQLPVLSQSGADCGFHSLYNAVCLKIKRYKDLVNRQKFEEMRRAWKTYLFRNEANKKNIEPNTISRFLTADELESLIQNRDFQFFAHIRRNQRQQLNNQDGQAVYNFLQDNVSIIFDLNGLEAIFRNRDGLDENLLNNNTNELIGILGAAAGGHNHTLWNINRFRNYNANRQVIIVNEGYIQNGYSNGAHWFAMVIEYDPTANTDHLLITESMSNDYRRNNIIKRVYQLFRTDRSNNLNRIIDLMPQPVAA